MPLTFVLVGPAGILFRRPANGEKYLVDLPENIRLKTILISKAKVALADTLVPDQDSFLVSGLVTGPENWHEGGRPKLLEWVRQNANLCFLLGDIQSYA